MDSPVCGDEAYVALIGIDWADKKHDMVILDTKTGEKEHVVVEHTPEALAEWGAGLTARFEQGPVAVCVEQARGRWFTT